MNDLVKSSFSLNLTTLRFFGLYPRKNPSIVYLIYGYVMLLCSLLPDPLFSFLYYFRDEELSLSDAGLNLFILVAMLCFIPKMLPFIFTHKEIRECIYYLEVFNVRLQDKQKDIFDNNIWICRRNSRCFFFCTVLDNITWICQAVFFSHQEGKLPMDVWLPFDPMKNKVAFYLVYFIIALGVSYIIFTNAAVDTLISGLAYHAAGQIKILKDNLEFLLEYAEREASQGKNEAIYRKLRECTQHHHQIIRFVKKIEDCFSWIVFSQFFCSTVLICLCCFQLILLSPGSSTFLLQAVYLSTVLVQIYLYCYYGTTLYEESNTLVIAAYVGRWYEYDLRSRKALIIFMERAKVPMTVTAGKILNLSLRTFTDVLKKSYSLLAVLENY